MAFLQIFTVVPYIPYPCKKCDEFQEDFSASPHTGARPSRSVFSVSCQPANCSGFGRSRFKEGPLAQIQSHRVTGALLDDQLDCPTLVKSYNSVSQLQCFEHHVLSLLICKLRNLILNCGLRRRCQDSAKSFSLK